jgi:hypothetical protein
MAIIGVLVGLLLPAVQAAREKIGLAVHGFHDTFTGIPPQATYVVGSTSSGYSVHARILPFVEHGYRVATARRYIRVESMLFYLTVQCVL